MLEETLSIPKFHRVLWLVALVMLFGCAGQPDVITGRVEKAPFVSVAADEEFEILVRLPPDYDTNTQTTYPVVYQLDASFLNEFQLSAGTLSRLATQQQAPETIVVGIGHTNKRPDRTRFVDFVPPHPTQTHAPSRAPEFFKFMHDELFPWVESRYRVDHTAGRTLSGHSLGGLFALYAFVQREDDGTFVFRNVVAADPSYGVNQGAIFAYEAQLATATRSRPGRLHLSASLFTGASQWIAHQEMSQRLSRDFSDLSLRPDYVDTTHGGLIPIALDRGLAFVLGSTP